MTGEPAVGYIVFVISGSELMIEALVCNVLAVDKRFLRMWDDAFKLSKVPRDQAVIEMKPAR